MFRKIIVPIIVIILWYICSLFTIPLFIPSPISVFNSGMEMIKSGMLLKGLLYSFNRIKMQSSFLH
jgi:ABC-type nitrate/sulfonate/bicarbonate transport system permease component